MEAAGPAAVEATGPAAVETAEAVEAVAEQTGGISMISSVMPVPPINPTSG